MELDSDNLFLALLGEKGYEIVLGKGAAAPIYEEVLLVGYIIEALKGKKGIVFATNISVLFRFLCHLYQGPMAAINIIPMGLLFAYVYNRWEKLFPLIVAHSILDFIGLLGLAGYSPT